MRIDDVAEIFKSRLNFNRPFSPLGSSIYFSHYDPLLLILLRLAHSSLTALVVGENPRIFCGIGVFAMKGGKSKANTSKKADSKLAVKKGVEKKTKAPKAKGKAGKDPNKPKRPPSAFFVFMEQFRKDFKEKNPSNKQVSVVGKAGGDKWKSMSQSEKAPYVTKAEKLKAEYQKKIKAYDAGEETKKDAASDEASDKSKSEVSDEEEGSDEEDEEDDD